jgi:hypothetical protein
MINGVPNLDQDNSGLWNELCGSHQAKALGITGRSAEYLKKFDGTLNIIHLSRTISHEAMNRRAASTSIHGTGSWRHKLKPYVDDRKLSGTMAVFLLRCK